MSIAEKLVRIADREQKVYDAGYWNGHAVGEQDGKNSVYQTVTVTQDCTNVKQCWDVLSASNNETDKIVLFVNKKWDSVPDNTFVNNSLLYMLWCSTEFISGERGHAWWLRWRDGAYSYVDLVNTQYDCNISAGDEFIKVVIL